MNSIPAHKLVVLDKLIPEFTGNFGAVYEDFENDIYESLKKAPEQLGKYKTLKLIFPDYTYHPKEILKGFVRFCQDYAFNYEIISDITDETIQKETVYISLMEDDLVILLEKILNADLKTGADVGVISYNETPLKKIILNGISTISTNFKMMGSKAAEMILSNKMEKIKIPFELIIRKSL